MDIQASPDLVESLDDQFQAEGELLVQRHGHGISSGEGGWEIRRIDTLEGLEVLRRV